MSSGPTQHTNRLAQATSPYLLQHQHNPVDWWQWGPDALAEARNSNRPILLSVGYAACHWCHVMAHESFEDPATAQVMNELFVCIKVDREERPDIDQIYMQALHLLGEQGGWPLTMFLTPAGEPVWGGTYFPVTARYGRPAFKDILREVARVFREEQGTVDQNRAALLAGLAEKARPTGQVVIGRRELDIFAQQIAKMFDSVHGGLRGAPKFPQCTILELLWRAGLRTQDQRFFETVVHTLEHMCEGGIYDHLGGGFSRYSVDAQWLVPHFEKMLYDNAQLLELLALAHSHTGNDLFRQRAVETVGWLTREMRTAEGAFSASLDADSEGEEGKFYVWSLAEMQEILGPEDAAFFAEIYDVTLAGNFEGHNILNRIKQLAKNSAANAPGARRDFMLQQDRSKSSEAENIATHNNQSMLQQTRNMDKIAAMRDKLFAARGRRARPGLDDKILADWNGLMIAALANAGVQLSEPAWIVDAQQAFDFIVKQMTRGDRLGHSWRAGQLLFPGLASDFAAMIRAAIALAEATANPTYLHQAVVWQAALDRHYSDPDTGSYYLTADDAEGLVLRPHSTADDAIPNHTGLTAQNLVRLAALIGGDRYRARADQMFDGILSASSDNLFSRAALLNALDMRHHGAEIVVVGTGDTAAALTAAALAQPFTSRFVQRTAFAELPSTHPAYEKIKAAQAAGLAAAAFVCVGERCSLPVTSPIEIARTVSDMRTGPAAG